jgi:hypothetical protein
MMKEKIGRQYVRQSSASAARVCLSPDCEAAPDKMTLQRVVTNAPGVAVFAFGDGFKSGPASANHLVAFTNKTQRAAHMVASWASYQSFC